MATCNNCGYKNANSGYNCPACGTKVNDGANLILAIGIIAVLVVIIGLVVVPGFLLYMAIKTKENKYTNWWLLGAIAASGIAIYLSRYFEEGGDWSWLGTATYYVNIIVLPISTIAFFFRLKNENYQVINLFNNK
ncbi:hypothetical protein G5B10_07670 [Fluviicola sp. SGL-29]|nr:hypothetical protein [Fluviicola sp. SGL-29]